MTGNEQINTTVAIVGAGMAGLVAARELQRAGIDVMVLEAAARIGGRVMSETSALGSRLDLGGQWIGHDHHRVAALAAELGASAFKMHSPLLPGVIDGARKLSFLSPAVLAALPALATVAALSLRQDSTAWNLTPVSAWLDKLRWQRTRRLLEVAAEVSWTADLDRYSVHAMLRMIRCQGGLLNMLSTRGGAQESLLVEGMGTLADRLARELHPQIRTSQRVLSIHRDDQGATLHTSQGAIRARRVIITAPPPMAARITHQPPLPAERLAVEQNSVMGSVYKAVAIYEQPFWRARHDAEGLILDAPGCGLFDTSPPGGPGHLCMLVGGASARTLDGLDSARRREIMLRRLVPHFGDEILTPAGWHEKSWHEDECAGGGYIALPLPGSTAGLPPMPTPPTDCLHWAGAETASEHPGYIDGAIESGLRAAREVMSRLRCP